MKRVYYESTNKKWNEETYYEWKGGNIPATKLKDKIEKEVGVEISPSLSFNDIFFVKDTDEEKWNKPKWIISLNEMSYHDKKTNAFYNQFRANHRFNKGKEFTENLNKMRDTLRTFEEFIIVKTKSGHHVSWEEGNQYKSISSGLVYWNLLSYQSLLIMVPYRKEETDIPDSYGEFNRVPDTRFDELMSTLGKFDL